MKERIGLYLKVFKWFLVLCVVGLFFIFIFAENESPAKEVVIAYDTLYNKNVIGVKHERSVEKLSYFLDYSYGKRDSLGTELIAQTGREAHEWRIFFQDTVHIMHGDRMLIQEILDDSVTLEVKRYSTLLKTFSGVAFVNRRSIVKQTP